MVNKDEVKKYKKMQIWFVIWAIIIAFFIIDICIVNSHELKPQNFNIVIILTIFGLIVPATIIEKKYKDSLDGISKEKPTEEFLDAYAELYKSNYHTIAVLKEDAKGFQGLFNFMTVVYLGVIFLLLMTIEKMEFLSTVVILFLATRFIVWSAKKGKNEKIDDYKKNYKTEVVAKLLKLIDRDLIFNVEPRYESNLGLELEKLTEYRSYIIEDEIIINLIEGKKFYYYDVVTIHENEKTPELESTKTSRGYVEFETFIPNMEEIQIYSSQRTKYIKQSENDLIIDLFEDEIKVKTTNIGYTKALLNEDLIYLIYNFIVKNNVDLVITIKDSKVNMLLDIDGLFEPNLRGEILDGKILYKYYYVIKCMTEIANEFIKSSKEIEDNLYEY